MTTTHTYHDTPETARLSHARQSARGTLKCITEDLARLTLAERWDESDLDDRVDLCRKAGISVFAARHDECPIDHDEAQETIDHGPLSVEVRSGWYTPGDTPEPSDYCLLMGTGGPAVRIRGELGQWNQPSTARLECQDWFTPWTEVETTTEENDVLLAYASRFYYGD